MTQRQPLSRHAFPARQRILCLRFPHWPIQRLRAIQPELCGLAVALVERDARRGELLSACSPEAEGLGLRIGLPVAEALTLSPVGTTGQVSRSSGTAGQASSGAQFSVLHSTAGQASSGAQFSSPHTPHLTPHAPLATRHTSHAPRLTLLPHDRVADLAALGRLAEWCERFSPVVGWRTATSPIAERFLSPQPPPAALLLERTGLPEPADPEHLAAEIALALQQAGYHAVIAAAETVGAAWALAHAASEAGQAAASDWLQAPLAALRLPPAVLTPLAHLGLTQIEELLALPREELTLRFGPELLWRLDQALGAAPEWIEPHRPEPEFFAELAFEHPLTTTEHVEQALREALGTVAARLATQRRGALRLECLLELGDGRRAEFGVGLHRPSASLARWWSLLRLHLEQLVLSAGVERLSAAAPLTGELAQRQGEFVFREEEGRNPSPGPLPQGERGSGNPSPYALSQRERRLGSREQEARADLFELLSNRLGRTAVLQPLPQAEVLPERAYRTVPLTGGAVSGGASSVRAAAGSRPRKRSRAADEAEAYAQPAGYVAGRLYLRPLLLFPQPQRIAVAASASGQPEQIHLHGCNYAVCDCLGPERLETGWRQGPTVRRDYFRVATAAGWWWVFYDLVRGSWFRHGLWG